MYFLVPAFDFLVAQQADHVNLCAILYLFFGRIKAEFTSAGQAFSLYSGEHFSYEDVSTEFSHHLAAHGTSHWSWCLLKSVDTFTTKRMAAWRSDLCVQERFLLPKGKKYYSKKAVILSSHTK